MRLDRARRVLGLSLLALLPARLPAYNLSGQRWTGTTVAMQLQLGPSPGALLDGSTSWGAAAEDALAQWNASLTNVHFTVVRDSTVAQASGNGFNNVFWSPTVYGGTWGSRTLAITLSNYNTSTRAYTEADVLFNNTLSWNSYRGALKTAAGGGTLYDFHRVALHEFGHALGLNHPDDIGQSVSAVMNSATSDVDSLTADDIAGARAIYDGAGAVVASLLGFQGSVSFQFLGSSLTLHAGSLNNTGNATSGTVRLELWAMPQHYADGLPPGSQNLGIYAFSSVLAPGGSFPNVTATTKYTPPAAGNYFVVLLLTEFTGGSGSGYAIRDWIEFSSQLTSTSGAAPAFTTQPAGQSVNAGAAVTLSAAAAATGGLSYQWQQNGDNLSSATGPTLALTNVQSASTGLYAAVATSSGNSATSTPAIVGVLTASKVIGTGAELQPVDIVHPNKNVFDQVLLTGAAETITADAGQVTRTSYIDENDDIVQVEFSGKGSLSLMLDNPSGPAAPVNYNQPTVGYMKGRAGIVIVGADATTNVSVFTVGRATAFDPTGAYDILQAPGATNVPAANGSSLFVGHGATAYDGIADIAFIAIASVDGKFGGLRTSNASYSAAKGVTGVYAPGVQFQGPVFVGDITASDAAAPMLVIGSSPDTRITGGDLLQTNGQPVKVSGLAQLKFTAGGDSHGNTLAAKNNRAVLLQDGVDVTAQVVINPTP